MVYSINMHLFVTFIALLIPLMLLYAGLRGLSQKSTVDEHSKNFMAVSLSLINIVYIVHFNALYYEVL